VTTLDAGPATNAPHPYAAVSADEASSTDRSSSTRPYSTKRWSSCSRGRGCSSDTESQIADPGTISSRVWVPTRDPDSGRSGEIHVLLNSCRHRRDEGVPLRLGNTLQFTCPYTGWSYSMDGTLVSRPVANYSECLSSVGHWRQTRPLAMGSGAGAHMYNYKASFSPVGTPTQSRLSHTSEGV